MEQSTLLDLDQVVDRFASSVAAHEAAILAALTSQCTLHSAQTELQQVLELAADLRQVEAGSHPERQGRVYSFLPRNNLLYSIALYALIPAALGYGTTLRAPASLRETVRSVWELSGLGRVGHARLHLGSQRDFTRQFSDEDIVVFTGQSTNGKNIEASTRHRLFLGFGSSHNPTIAMPGAGLDKLVQDLVFARMYNAGADCLAPDIIFVHNSLVDDLKSALIAELETLPMLEKSDADRIAHSNSPDPITAERAQHIIHSHSDRIAWSGPRSEMRNYVPTTVLHSQIADAPVSEMFAPIFNLVEFDDPGDVVASLEESCFRGSEMYLSRYGADILAIPHEYTLCQDSSPFEHESALTPFGGYGVQATWRTHSGATRGQPISVFHELGGVV